MAQHPMTTGNVFLDQMAMMSAFGNTVHSVNPEQAKLYTRLMLEEVEETMIALYPAGEKVIKELFRTLKDFIVVDENSDLVAAFDGVTDVLVVTLGLGFSLGLPLQQGWNEVHGTNMAKVDPETGMVRRREDGKVLKPEGWEPPNLEAVLIRLGMQRTIPTPVAQVEGEANGSV